MNRANVPCAGCRACCQNEMVPLMEEDDASQYETETIDLGKVLGEVLVLKRKANGECHYLGPEGCTIHDRAPRICQEFDCRLAVARVPRKERRARVASGLFDKAVYDAGRARLHTLSKS